MSGKVEVGSKAFFFEKKKQKTFVSRSFPLDSGTA